MGWELRRQLREPGAGCDGSMATRLSKDYLFCVILIVGAGEDGVEK